MKPSDLARRHLKVVVEAVEKNSDLGLAKNIAPFNASLILARWRD